MSPRKDIGSSLVLIFFSVTFLVYTARYPLDSWESPGPAVFPLVLGGVLLILALGQLIRAFMAPGTPERGREKGSVSGAVRTFFRDHQGEAKVLILAFLLVIYLLVMQWLGFFVSTFLLVILTSRLMEAKGWVRPILLSAGVCLFCYVLFVAWIKLSFPQGLLF